MISALDMKAFGRQLAEIRRQARITQREVYEQTGLNEDTLRRIEQGKVVPKYETLDILSRVYKINLSVILSSYRTDAKLTEIIDLLDEVMVGDPPKIKKQLQKLSQEVEEYEMATVTKPEEIELLKAFFEISSSVLSPNFKGPGKSILMLEEVLRESIPGFSWDQFESFRYSELELRLLLLAGLIYHRHNNYERAIPILKFSLDYIELTKGHSTESSLMVQIKIYYGLSYAAYKQEQDKASLEYADLGLKICQENRSVYLMELLLARKGIAYYYLKNPDFMKPFRQAFHLLKAFDNQPMMEYLVRSIKTSHNIDLSPLMEGD